MSEIRGRLFKDEHEVTHLVRFETRSRNGRDTHVKTVCGIGYDIASKDVMERQGTIDCMACIVAESRR